MKKRSKNKRILKKLSKRSAFYLNKVSWDSESEDLYCERAGYLRKGTPVLWYRCTYEYQEYESICAWTALKRLYVNERDYAKAWNEDWQWSFIPTPTSVFDWALKNSSILNGYTESRFGY